MRFTPLLSKYRRNFAPEKKYMFPACWHNRTREGIHTKYYNSMKENKKAILEILKKKSSKKEGKKDDKFESLVLNLALQKIDSDDFDYDGEAVYTTDKKRLIYCMSNEASFTIPEGVTIIGEMAFRGKKQLKNVIIANSVKEIEHDAFYDCDELDNVYIPAGVKEVRGYAFAECDKLKKITFAGVPAKLSRHTFDDCDQLHDIIVPEGASKTFRKALHFIEGDTDFLVTEMGGKKSDAKAQNDKKESVKAEESKKESKKTEEKKSEEKNVQMPSDKNKKEEKKKAKA